MEKAILRTICYHDIFDYPLLVPELWKFLITDKVMRKKVVIKRLVQMKTDRKQIEADGGFYFLRGRRKIVRLRKRREEYSRKKLLMAKRVVRWLRLMPSVKMVGVTGAVAVGNAIEKDDIDLMIVTAHRRLWLTRFWLVLWLGWLNKRRRPEDKKVRDKICLNIFLDEEQMRMPKIKRNLFVAHEIGQMKVLFAKDKTDERFLEENEWVKGYLANVLKVKSQKLKVKSFSSKFKVKYLAKLLFGIPLLLIEKMAYWGQLKYMKKRMTYEKVSPYWAFFHPQDVTEKVLGEYRKRVREISNFQFPISNKISNF